MKFCEIGVYHHDCWFTDAINHFPELHVREVSGRVHDRTLKNRVVSAVYRVFSPDPELPSKLLGHISANSSVFGVLEVKPLELGSTTLAQVAWKAPLTSYDVVLGSGGVGVSGGIASSSCYSKDGYETYSVFADDPNRMQKLLSELGQIGEVKMFSVKNSPLKSKTNKQPGLGIVNGLDSFGLTQKQKQAIISAISMGYYSWPKQVNLEELAAKLGVKRRALQENLRKAESKVLPKLLDDLAGK